MKSLRGSFSLLILCTLCARADRSLASPPGRYTAQLAFESDGLVQLAIRRPYGWGWDDDLAGESKGHPLPRAVTMTPLGTPAAGLILLWAGKLLNEPRYLSAAEQVARGVSASQMAIGRIRSHPIFGATAGGREELVPIPDRSATKCALALLLARIDASQPTTESTVSPLGDADSTGDPRAEAIRATAARCAHWLAKQQAPNGVWPSIFSPGTDASQSIRLTRLDDADYRDCTLALLLSFDLLHDDSLHHFSTVPLDGLLRLRLVNDVHGPGLWCTACTVGGMDIPAKFPDGPDLLASRYAMQTLFGGYLFTGNRDLESALNDAAKSLAQIKPDDGIYDRFLDPTAAADVARSLGQDAPTTRQFFAHPTTKPQDGLSIITQPSTNGSFGIAEILSATTRLHTVGRDVYFAPSAAGFSFHQQIEACLCGLIDDPLTMDFPATPQEIPAYLSAHIDLWKIVDEAAPDNLPERVRRLWILLLRAKLERMAG